VCLQPMRSSSYSCSNNCSSRLAFLRHLSWQSRVCFDTEGNVLENNPFANPDKADFTITDELYQSYGFSQEHFLLCRSTLLLCPYCLQPMRSSSYSCSNNCEPPVINTCIHIYNGASLYLYQVVLDGTNTDGSQAIEFQPPLRLSIKSPPSHTIS